MNLLRIQIPDFATVDPVFGGEKPFSLWEVVDQPLLFHWFDYAVDQNVTQLEILCPPHLHGKVKHSVKEATLWPIDIRVIDQDAEGSTDIPVANRLPHQEAKDVPELEAPEDLLAWQVALSVERLDHIWNVLRLDFPFLVQGHGSRVHPKAVLEGPYWIGDEAEIEAGAYIGAHSVIGHGARVRKGARIRDSHLAPGVEVTPRIRLDGHMVAPGLIFNHRRRLLHQHVDPQVVRCRSGHSLS